MDFITNVKKQYFASSFCRVGCLRQNCTLASPIIWCSKTFPIHWLGRNTEKWWTKLIFPFLKSSTLEDLSKCCLVFARQFCRQFVTQFWRPFSRPFSREFSRQFALLFARQFARHFVRQIARYFASPLVRQFAKQCNLLSNAICLTNYLANCLKHRHS
jgi:hypothetical protein